MTEVLAGLDIASTTGCALLIDRKIITQTFKAGGAKRFLDRDDDKSIDARRMGEAGRSFEDHLMAWLIEHAVTHVAIEAPLNTTAFDRKRLVAIAPEAAWAGGAKQFEREGGANLATWFKIYGLEFLACTVCARLNIPCEFVNQSTWRKAFLGNGRPGKDAKHQAKAMCQKMGIECTSLDAAEAAGVVFWLDQFLHPYGARRANDLFKAEA